MLLGKEGEGNKTFSLHHHMVPQYRLQSAVYPLFFSYFEYVKSLQILYFIMQIVKIYVNTL